MFSLMQLFEVNLIHKTLNSSLVLLNDISQALNLQLMIIFSPITLAVSVHKLGLWHVM